MRFAKKGILLDLRKGTSARMWAMCARFAGHSLARAEKFVTLFNKAPTLNLSCRCLAEERRERITAAKNRAEARSYTRFPWSLF